jgi:hypothetical protein
MLSRALQIDLQSLFHSKYGRRVNYYFDAKRNDVDGAMLWEAATHFDGPGTAKASKFERGFWQVPTLSPFFFSSSFSKSKIDPPHENMCRRWTSAAA